MAAQLASHPSPDIGPLTDELSETSAVVLAFVVAGHLLSSEPFEDGKWWFDYLDWVEATIEVAG